MLQMLPIVAALAWDPTVRGALIVTTSVVILVGSVFLLLSTNVGARLAFLLTMCGLFGWLTCQGLVWTVYAQGNKGSIPHWKAQELITGDVDNSIEERVRQLPDGWRELREGDKVLGDATAAADHLLVKPKPTVGHGSAPSEPPFPPIFDEAADYLVVGAYATGGETYPKLPVVPDSWDFISVKHKPHYVVVQVQKVVAQQPGPDGKPPKPVADTSQPTISVVMVRDLGSVRLPPAMLMVSSGIVFGVLLYILHRRDKEIMAARASETVG